MTSIPASRSARAMIFAPRSCPSSPGLATTTRILRVEVAAAMSAILAPHDELHALVAGTVDRADDRVRAGARELLGEPAGRLGAGAELRGPLRHGDVVQ